MSSDYDKEYECYERIMAMAKELPEPGDLGYVLTIALASMTAGATAEDKQIFLGQLPAAIEDLWFSISAGQALSGAGGVLGGEGGDA